MRKTILPAFRRALIAGTLVLLPLAVTIWVFVSLVKLADSFILLLPDWAHPETYLGFPLPGLGILLTLVVVTSVGFATRYYTGRQIIDLYERMLARVPVLSGIYHGVKQLVQTLFVDQGKHFRQVVIVEYPRRGIYCLAFLTNTQAYLDIGDDGEPNELVSVFLPTTPNPTSGFYLMLPRRDVQVVEISVEEAFKVIMSAGIVLPGGIRVTTVMEPGKVREVAQKVSREVS